MSECRFFQVTPSGKFKPLTSLADALSLPPKEHGYIWLDYSAPSKEDLSALIEPLGIHPLSIEDCLDEQQIPKIENFPGNTFVLMNTYRYDAGSLVVQEVDFIVGSNFLVSVSGPQAGGERFYERVEEYIRLELDNVRRGPDCLLHVLLDYTVDNNFVAIEAVQDEIDTVEEELLKDPASFKPGELMHLRRHLLSLRKSLFHGREVLMKICRRDSPFISEKAVYHFRDIYDHLTKFFEMVEIYREMITSLMEMYLSMINNQMTMVANRTNRVMRRLTLITTIFMPLTLLAGIGGMSEWSMMTGPQNWKVAYPLFLLALVPIGVANYYLLRRVERRSDEAERGDETGGEPPARPKAGR